MEETRRIPWAKPRQRAVAVLSIDCVRGALFQLDDDELWKDVDEIQSAKQVCCCLDVWTLLCVMERMRISKTPQQIFSFFPPYE